MDDSDSGDETETETGIEGIPEGPCAITVIAQDWTRSTVRDIALLGDSLILAEGPPSSEVHAIDLGGGELWGQGHPSWHLGVYAVHVDESEIVVAAREDEPEIGLAMRSGALTLDGSLTWGYPIDVANSAFVMGAELEARGPGDYYMSWDGSGQVHLARFVSGSWAQWVVSSQSNGPIDLAHNHGLAVLPDGSALLLLRLAETLGLEQRAAEDGALLAELTLPVEAAAADLTVLPDGAIFVLGNHPDGGAVLIEINLDGTIIADHDYATGSDERLVAMAWDETQGLMLLSGTARPEGGGERTPWWVVVDREGVELFNARAEGPTVVGETAAIMSLGDGGFVESREPERNLYSIVCDLP